MDEKLKLLIKNSAIKMSDFLIIKIGSIMILIMISKNFEICIFFMEMV
jgi:hypothetical protein